MSTEQEQVFNFKVENVPRDPSSLPLYMEIEKLLCSLGTVVRWTLEPRDTDNLFALKGSVLFKKLSVKKKTLLFSPNSLLRGSQDCKKRIQRIMANHSAFWPVGAANNVEPSKSQAVPEVDKHDDRVPVKNPLLAPAPALNNFRDTLAGVDRKAVTLIHPLAPNAVAEPNATAEAGAVNVDEPNKNQAVAEEDVLNIYDEDTIPMENALPAPAPALNNFRDALAVAEREVINLVHLPARNAVAEANATAVAEYREPPDDDAEWYRGERLGYLPFISQRRLPQWATKKTPTLIRIVDHCFFERAKHYRTRWNYQGICHDKWTPAGIAYKDYRREVIAYNKKLLPEK